MKYYETTFEEYMTAVETYNLHPELEQYSFPKNIKQFKNIILYGPSGVGKYTQALKIIKPYSSSGLKYDKRLIVSNEKTEKKVKSKVVNKKSEYAIRVSDIHFEIDMATLGCNSRNIWHDIYFQIVEVVSTRQERSGIIVCKNFHSIYNELLDVFHSYIRHPLQHYNIQLTFILLTEHVGFIPDRILNTCLFLPVSRPTKDKYKRMMETNKTFFLGMPEKDLGKTEFYQMINEIDCNSLVNNKEIHILKRAKTINDLPRNLIDITTQNIILQLSFPQNLQITEFRNLLYDLFIYQVDVPESICLILYFFIENNRFSSKELISSVIRQLFIFFQYYNNNYRSIYHLESILFFILNASMTE
jgi:hypothetical protein